MIVESIGYMRNLAPGMTCYSIAAMPGIMVVAEAPSRMCSLRWIQWIEAGRSLSSDLRAN